MKLVMKLDMTISIHMDLLTVVLCISLLKTVSTFSHFRDRIPNGHHIEHPCKVSYMWYGVGHTNPLGTGKTNPFGADFEKHGFEWNSCLCQADSDGDGLTNGQELGDPDCTWKPGQVPGISKGLTHPGICQPVNDTKCLHKNSFLNCDRDLDIKCDAINETDVKKWEIRLDKTEVPSVDTTYICQAFDIPVTGEFHIIASSAHIDTEHFLHHVLVHGCADDQVDTVRQKYKSPTKCGLMSVCNNLVAVWALGSGSGCENKAMGYRIGNSGYKLVVLEVHWNNPELRRGEMDASGMDIYYTDKLRPNDGGSFFAGPSYLQIPPGFLDHKTYGGCPSECTDYLLEGSPIYITHIIPHMHYLGSNFLVEIVRGNEVVKKIDVPYYYIDNPQPVTFPNPVEIRPGDNIKVVCGFSSKLRKNQFTYYGEGTHEEMCFANIQYYPYKVNTDLCSVTDGFGRCGKTKNIGDPYQHCNYTDFEMVLAQHLDNINRSCDETGIVCRYGCEAAMAKVVEHPCYTSPAVYYIRNEYTKYLWGRKLLTRLASCDPRPVMAEDNDPNYKNKGNCNSGTKIMSINQIYDHFGVERMTVKILIYAFLYVCGIVLA